MNNNRLLQSPMEERSPSREAGISINQKFTPDVNYDLIDHTRVISFANVSFILLNF